MSLQTSVLSRVTFMLLNRFAALWGFKFCLVAENLTQNHNCPQANVKGIPDGGTCRALADLAWGSVMQRDEICVCGHPQFLHRSYGCLGTRPNPDLKKTEHLECECKAFKARKAAHA